MITLWIAAVRKRINARRRYARVVADIELLTDRELSDLRADPFDIIRQARAEIYGESD